MARRNLGGVIGNRHVARASGIHSLGAHFERQRDGEWPNPNESSNPAVSGPWVRPVEWLPMPSLNENEQKVAGLIEITNDDSNYVAVSATALPVAVVTTATNTTDASSYNVAVDLAKNGIYAIAIHNTHGTSAPAVASIAGSGAPTFTERSTLTFNGGLNRVTIFTATAAAAFSGNLTFDFGGTTVTSFLAGVYRISDVTPQSNDAYVQVATATGSASTASVALGAAPTGLVFAVTARAASTGSTPGSGFTEITDINVGTPASNLHAIWGSAATATASGSSIAWGMIAVEFSVSTDTSVTVDWGDGTSSTVASGAVAEKKYTYSAISSTTNTLEGSRQALVTITSPAGIRTINLRATHSGAATIPIGSGYVYRWKDLAIALPFLTAATSLVAPIAQRIVIASCSQTSAASLFITNCGNMRVAVYRTMSVLKDMSSMFGNCYALQDVDLPDTSSVTNMASAFSGCYSLQIAPWMNTGAVTNFSSTFANCRSLTRVPQYNTSSATNMGSMFTQCYNLESVPLFDTALVTTVNNMFRECSTLVTIPPFNMASVTNTGGFLYDTPSLRYVPDISAPLTTDFGTIVFSGATGRLEYWGLTGGTLAAGSIGFAVNSNPLRYWAPLNCASLTSAISGFSGCPSLTSLVFNGLRYGATISNFFLNTAALETFMSSLGIAAGAQTVTITGNPGAPAPVSLSGTTTAGSTTVTMANTAGLVVGMEISGVGISDAVAVTFQDTGDTVTRTAHGLANDTRISFASISSTTGISTYTYYYVVNAAADTFQVASTVGGAALPLTTNGSGTMLYGTTIAAIAPNTSITLSIPASASGTVTTSSAVLKRSLARLKGFAVSG